MKKFYFSWILFVFVTAAAQEPAGYYNSAAGLEGAAMQQALHNIIDGHNAISYSALWNAYEDTDKKPNGKVWDMYSDVPGGTPPYQFTFFSDQCGNYNSEGDCYNREHSFPRSWFGGTVAPMNTDLFQVYPTDGYVNGKRGNYPYGEVGTASWTSLNGCKLGSCITPGYSGVVFEPIDAYKGDFARTYFYMATRYLGEDNNWPGSPMVNGAQPKAWALQMLHTWHLDDPVSDKEVARNNAVYAIQQNRNPYIDHPEFVEIVWFDPNGVEEPWFSAANFSVYPNPTADILYINSTAEAAQQPLVYSLSDATGRIITTIETDGQKLSRISLVDLPPGFYLLHITDQASQQRISYKIFH